MNNVKKDISERINTDIEELQNYTKFIDNKLDDYIKENNEEISNMKKVYIKMNTPFSKENNQNNNNINNININNQTFYNPNISKHEPKHYTKVAEKKKIKVESFLKNYIEGKVKLQKDNTKNADFNLLAQLDISQGNPIKLDFGEKMKKLNTTESRKNQNNFVKRNIDYYTNNFNNNKSENNKKSGIIFPYYTNNNINQRNNDLIKKLKQNIFITDRDRDYSALNLNKESFTMDDTIQK